jgi:hypothetical protein
MGVNDCTMTKIVKIGRFRVSVPGELDVICCHDFGCSDRALPMVVPRLIAASSRLQQFFRIEMCISHYWFVVVVSFRRIRSRQHMLDRPDHRSISPSLTGIAMIPSS